MLHFPSARLLLQVTGMTPARTIRRETGEETLFPKVDAQKELLVVEESYIRDSFDTKHP